MKSFYKALTESKKPEYLTMDLVMLWDKPERWEIQLYGDPPVFFKKIQSNKTQESD